MSLFHLQIELDLRHWLQTAGAVALVERCVILILGVILVAPNVDNGLLRLIVGITKAVDDLGSFLVPASFMRATAPS